MRDRGAGRTDPELSGVKKPKSEEERERLLKAARALGSVDTGVVGQSPDSVDATLDRLRELHGEMSRERTAAPPTPWYRRTWLVAGSLAAAAAVVVLVIFLAIGIGPEPEPIGTLVSVRGDISVVTEDGSVETAGEGGEIAVSSGAVVETRRDSRGTLQLDSDSEIRLDSSTSVEVAYESEDRLQAKLYRGNAYHRIVEGEDYDLSVDGLEVSGSGCAFNTELGVGQLTVVTVFGTTTVVDEVEETVCRQGQKVVAERPLGEAALAAVDLSAAELGTPWLSWNIERDEESGFDTGGVEEEPAGPADGETKEPAEVPAEERASEDAQGDPEPPRATPRTSASLSGEPGTTANALNWSLENVPAGGRAVLLRSRSGECAYPEDQYAVVGSRGPYADGDVRGGETYSYRIAVVSGGSVAALSNRVDLPVPLSSEIALGASSTAGGALISWNWTANFDVTQVALVRSSDGTTPEYPPVSGGQRAWLLSAGATTFSDSSLQPDTTYRYRVFLLSGSSVAGGSNEAEVVVPRAQSGQR